MLFLFLVLSFKNLSGKTSASIIYVFWLQQTQTRADTLQMGKGKMLDVESHTEIGLIFMNTGYQTHGFKDF